MACVGALVGVRSSVGVWSSVGIRSSYQRQLPSCAPVFKPSRPCYCPTSDIQLVFTSHPVCSVLGSGLRPRRLPRIACLQVLVPAPRCLPHTLLHCHLHSLSPTLAPVSYLKHTAYTAPTLIAPLASHTTSVQQHTTTYHITHTFTHTHKSFFLIILGCSRPTPCILPSSPRPPSSFPPGHRALHCRELYCTTTVCRSLVCHQDGLRPCRDSQLCHQAAGESLSLSN